MIKKRTDKFNPNQKGFTITELSIAMSMLSVLLIIILMSILNIISVYNKGITLKRVNQSGRAISAEIQSDLRQAKSGGGGIGERHDEDTNGDGATDENDALTGICTGKTSYMWNVYKDGVVLTNITYADVPTERISFVKFSDDGKFCREPASKPTKAQSSVLVDDGLAINEPVRLDPDKSNRHQLIRFTFTISTENQGSGADTDISGGSCQGGAGHDFCALNTFVVTSYAKGVQ